MRTKLPSGFGLLVLLALGIAASGAGAQDVATTEINVANQAELEQVAGLGPQLVERLLQARHERLFASWADAQKRIKGLGPASAKRLSDHGLRVNGQAWSQPTTSPSP
ncbi:MAG: hypothetical protein C4K60_19925 [Ideonella sp. MAG2]|nr:MAG: hypothetical protein C4K60_19925 [Ideonella sp. MAG2]